MRKHDTGDLFSSLPYGWLFSKGFIYRYFEEALLFKNNFLSPVVLQK